MRKLSTTAAALWAALALPAAAAPPARAPAPAAPICGQILRAIEGSEKELSRQWADDIGDNSAPRATLRATKMSVEVQLISANLAQLAAHRCPAYGHPISNTAYMVGAMECHTAMRNIETKMILDPGAKVSSPPECDSATWSRLGAK